jgi:integrase
VATVHAPPKVEEREIEILTAEQIVETMIKLEGHALYPVAALAIATSMRRGELVGLQWAM